MVADYVIDTNVWVNVDKSVAEMNSPAEITCVRTCVQWMNNFIQSEDRLIIDSGYRILGEYRRNIASGGTAEIWLSKLETRPRDRLFPVNIEFDEHNQYALLSDGISIKDPEDRKFVAVALAHGPTTIVYSTDTDWREEYENLTSAGLELIELCPDYIDEKLK